MPNNAEAGEFKAAGNKALQSGNLTSAIENYTKAINADRTNHVYYSNRSAAYLMKGDGNNALEDANSTIAINPDFSKGYSRKGAALHALKRYNDAIAAYEEGLVKFPDDVALKKGLDQVKCDKKEDGWEKVNVPDKHIYDEEDELVKNRQPLKFAARKISKSFSGVIGSIKKSLSFADGDIAIEIAGDLKVYKPHDKIKGVIKVNLKNATTAEGLVLTLKATRPIAADKDSFRFSNQETVCRESVQVHGSRVYLVQEEFPFELIVPKLEKDSKNQSLVSSLAHELKTLHFTGPATWTLFASLVLPGGSLWGLRSNEYRIHVDD